VATDIAVIGNQDSIDYFRVLGCETFGTKDGSLPEGKLDEIMKRRYRIIFITEEASRRYRMMIQQRRTGVLPIVTVIPDVRGSRWTAEGPVSSGGALEELRIAVVRAVGQDISTK
jgi:vacuolar-type H+-ATPase subunit F/Vma7